jgi:hypothetical protein
VLCAGEPRRGRSTKQLSHDGFCIGTWIDEQVIGLDGENEVFGHSVALPTFTICQIKFWLMHLKGWALQVGKRRGLKRARVALARKLGMALHRIGSNDLPMDKIPPRHCRWMSLKLHEISSLTNPFG